MTPDKILRLLRDSAHNLDIKGDFINSRNDLVKLIKDSNFKRIMPGFHIQLPESIYKRLENKERSLLITNTDFYTRFYIIDPDFIIETCSTGLMSFSEIIIDGFSISYINFVEFLRERFRNNFEFTKDESNKLTFFSPTFYAQTQLIQKKLH